MAGLSPTIGRIAGIKIELHWSFLLLLLFVLVLSLYVFALFVILFVCVLLHELSHSLTSLHYKVKVNKIVLLPIGGISVMDLDTVKPKEEFNIALAGPLASFALGALFLLFIPIAPAGIIHQTVVFTAEINLLLGVFNILPGFPLDGGRVFRAYLQRKRSYLKSTQITVKLSNVVLALFVIGTIIFAIYAKGYSLLNREFLVFYDVFIVMFLYSGSQAEMQSAYAKTYASNLYVKAALSKNFTVVDRNARLSSIYEKMLKSHTHIILFKDGSSVKLARIPSRLQSANDASPSVLSRPVYAYGMELPVVSYNTKLLKAVGEMQSRNAPLAVVTAGKKIVGVVFSQHADSIIALHVSKAMQPHRTYQK